MYSALASMDLKMNLALVAALASVVVALISGAFTLRAQRNLRVQQQELARLNDELQRRRTRSEAWIEYRFDGRKRLYDQCEPLFFQLAEASDYALRKCRDLAKPQVRKELEPTQHNLEVASGHWMLCDSTEVIATAYALFTPFAVFCLPRGVDSTSCRATKSITPTGPLSRRVERLA
jgi:hypothetical protein